MSTGAWNFIILVVVLLLMVGFFYYYVAGVVEENRTLSRASALAFLILGVWAVVTLVRIL